MTDAFVIGRIGVDLTPETPRSSLADATRFVRAVGGFAGNIGFGLARLGVSTAVISSVGDDGHGDHVRRSLAAEGINVEALLTRPACRTQVAFFEAWPPEHFPVTFYRPDPPPDTQLEMADVPLAALEDAPVAILSGTQLAAEPARSTTLAMLSARAAARRRRGVSWTILDLDWRPTLWADPGAYPALIADAARLSDVVIGSDSEFEAAGLRPGEAMGPGPAMTVLKHGPEGVSLLAGGTRHALAGIAVDVVCGLGSGDALTAAFAAGLLAGLDPTVALERGNAAGAIVASRLMCSAAMPVAAEIDEILSNPSNRENPTVTSPEAPQELTIHQAKLPSRLPAEMLHIKPGAEGVVATNPARSGWRYLSFRSFGLAEGEVALLDSPEQEAAIVTISGGGIEIALDGRASLELTGRPSVFEGMPWSAYIPAGTTARIIGRPLPGRRSVVAIAQAPLTGRTGIAREPIVVGPDDVQIEIRGAGNCTRQINNIMMPDFPADRLLICEVFTPSGNWSGWPPHKHDVDDPPREAVLEETYFYQFRRPEAWAIQRVYHRDGSRDLLLPVHHGDLVIVDQGYHPFIATPGYDAYFINALAGDRRTMANTDDPDLAWVRTLWPAMEPDPRLPLVKP